MNRTHLVTDDSMVRWTDALRAEVLTDLDPGLVSTIGETAAVVTGFGITAGILEGGIMSTTAFGAGAAAAAGFKAKLAATALAATLAASGAAAATGNLPAGTQSFVADVAAHIGLDLPRPDTELELMARVGVGADELVTVDGLGQIGVAFDGSGLVLTDITGNAGVTASIVVETGDTIIVEFVAQTEVATVTITREGEEIVSDVSRSTFSGSVDVNTELNLGWTGLDAEGSAEASADGSANGSTDPAEADAEASGSAHTEAGCGDANCEAEAGISVTVGVGG